MIEQTGMNWADVGTIIVSLITALGGFELIKYFVDWFRHRKQDSLEVKDNTVEFYKSELKDLQNMYRQLNEDWQRKYDKLEEEVKELRTVVFNQGTTIADLSSKLRLYYCGNTSCQYRVRWNSDDGKMLLKPRNKKVEK